MRVSDLCNGDVSSCSRDTSLARAGALMSKGEVGCLPVVDRQDRVIGIVTDRDIALELASRDAPASEIFVDEMMSDRITTCKVEDDVRDVLRLMARNEVRRLPVVDEEGRLQGILSIDDLICHASQDGDSRQLPQSEVLEAYCQITQSYQPETHSAPRNRGARNRSPEGGRPSEPETVERARRRGQARGERSRASAASR
ncbi:MAG TPA: CBS domain-containing protein [Planctomycetota bacterium]|nr:CBS domain-containing protein [Planctomycetota bacterium]